MTARRPMTLAQANREIRARLAVLRIERFRHQVRQPDPMPRRRIYKPA